MLLPLGNEAEEKARPELSRTWSRMRTSDTRTVLRAIGWEMYAWDVAKFEVLERGMWSLWGDFNGGKRPEFLELASGISFLGYSDMPLDIRWSFYFRYLGEDDVAVGARLLGSSTEYSTPIKTDVFLHSGLPRSPHVSLPNPEDSSTCFPQNFGKNKKKSVWHCKILEDLGMWNPWGFPTVTHVTIVKSINGA